VRPDGGRPNVTPQAAPLPTWDGPDYAHVPPGRYDAVVTRWQGPAWVRKYKRWSMLVEFELLAENVRVCAFFNMGTNPERTHAGPQSRYFHAWTIANGERPSAKQKLDPAVFMDGQIYKIEVSDSRADAEGKQKAKALVYSRVTAVLSAELCNQANHSIKQSPQSSDSFNQESEIMQSRNQESPNQGGRKAQRVSKPRVKASPGPGVGNAHAKQTRRAGAFAPAQAASPRNPLLQ
jgi:hypothetical protein